MEHLAGAVGTVSGVLEVPGQRANVLEYLKRAPVRGVQVHARGRGTQAGHERGTGGIAQRGGRVGIGKHHPAFGKTVHVRSLHLRMPAEGADPIVEVVNGYEQYVRLSALLREYGRRRYGREQHQDSG